MRRARRSSDALSWLTLPACRQPRAGSRAGFAHRSCNGRDCRPCARRSSSLGRIAILGEQRRRLHDLAGLAVAALRHLLGDPGLLQRMLALGVETFDRGDLLAGEASETAVWQERTASPLRWTVHAPHKPAPQPNFVPVICRCSRMTHNSGVSFGTSTEWSCPLMFRVTMPPWRFTCVTDRRPQLRDVAGFRRPPPCTAICGRRWPAFMCE